MVRRVIAFFVLMVFLPIQAHAADPGANSGNMAELSRDVEAISEEIKEGEISSGEEGGETANTDEENSQPSESEPTAEPTQAPMPIIAPVVSADIDMTITVGYSGTYVMYNWTEVVMDIENAGGLIDGFLEIDVFFDSQNYLTYRTPAVLPTGAKKRITLMILPVYLQSHFDVRLVEGDKIIHTQRTPKLTPSSPDMVLIGLLSQDPASLLYMGDNKALASTLYNTQSIALSADNFPQRVETLNAFKIIVIDNFDISLLSETQQDILSSWLLQGGVLIVGGGTRAELTLPSLYNLTGVKYDGMADTSNIDLEALNKKNAEFLFALNDPSVTYVVKQTEPINLEFAKEYYWPDMPALAKLSYDGELSSIISSGDIPLVVGGKRGGGLLIACAFDLGAKPYQNWEYAKMYVDKALTFAYGQNYMNLFNQKDSAYYSATIDRDYELIDATNNIPLDEMPDFTVITILLVVFLALVGPVGYVVLRLLNKRAWMWGLVPVMAIVFAVLVWGAGSRNKGNLPVATSVSIQRMDNQEPLKTIMGVASPKRGEHKLTTDVQGLPMFSTNNMYGRYSYYSGSSYSYGMSVGVSSTYYSPGSSQPNVSRMGIVEQGAVPGMTFMTPDVWGINQVGMIRESENTGGLVGRLYTKTDGIGGTVTNESDYLISDALLITAYGIEKLGDIEPGGAVDIFQQCKYKDGVMNIMQYSIWSVLDELFPYMNTDSADWQSATQGQRQAMLENAFKRSVISYIYNQKNNNRYYYQPNQYAMDCIIIGFNNEVGRVGMMLDNEPIERTQHRGVLYQQYKLSYEDDDGNLLIPAGLLNLEIDYQPNVRAYSDSGRIIIEQGQAVAQLTLPNLNLYDITKVEIKNFFRTPLKEAQLYDEEADEWVSFTDKNVTLEGKDLERFISYTRGSTIRIQYTLDDSEDIIPDGKMSSGVTLAPEFTVTGRRK